MKTREKPYELQLYEGLLYRKVFSHEEKRKYKKLKRGYEGELRFDALIEKIPTDYILLKDIWLSHHNRYFQIDNGLLFNNVFHLYEVKNFVGEYYYEDDKLFLESNIEIDDPLTQLRRTESLLRQLLQYYDFTIPVQSAIVFINPEFTLSQAPRNPQLLLPTQLNRYMKQFHRPTSLNPISYQIAEKLEAIKLTKSPFIQLPTYHFNELKKGIRCKVCRGLAIRIIGKRYICDDCGEIGLGQDVILQNIKEFLILFPEEKLTSQIILEWCGRMDLRRRIQYLLHNHFVKKSLKKGTYYVTK